MKQNNERGGCESNTKLGAPARSGAAADLVDLARYPIADLTSAGAPGAYFCDNSHNICLDPTTTCSRRSIRAAGG
jgi:hypothetical protein